MTTDWRNPAEYPDPETTKPATWKWEFLRRNSNYRKDWERCVELRMSRIRTGYGLRYDDDQGIYLGGVESDYMVTKEGDKSVTSHVHVHSYSIPGAEVAIARKYGINRMPDPGRGGPRLLRWETDKITIYGEFITEAYGQGSEMAISGGSRCSAITREGLYHLPVSAEKAYVELNLALPIETQLKRAKQVLKRQIDFKGGHPVRPVSKRKRESHYRTYLQLLDAEEAGVSKNDMAAALYPHLTNCYPSYTGRKTVANHLDAAKRLRDGGYRFLVGSKPTPA